TVPPSERITVAHIGVGGRGTSVQKEFMALDDVQSVAVCDPFQNRRDEAAARIDAYYAEKWGVGTYKGVEPYNYFEEVLDRDDIDAVVVATPDHWHVPIAIRAARAGKDMYVEKPLGVSMEQDWALRDELAAHKNIFQYGTQQRSERNFRFACELVQNGRIGELERIDVWCPLGGSGGSTTPAPVPENFDYDLWLGPAPYATYTVDRCMARGAFWVYDYSLGFVAGWGVHPLDIAQWGMDADDSGPVEVKGTGVIPTGGLFNTIMSWDYQIKYPSGVEIHFMSSDVAAPMIEMYRPPKEHGTTFFGSNGWVSVDRAGIYAEPTSLLDSEIGPDEIHLYESPEHRRNFIDCVKSRSQTICPIGSAVRVDTISHLCNISTRMGRPIKWDPENEKIVGDTEAEAMLSRPMRTPWTV
ncbi:MAG: Gfo/Idh/MocA family oxidoreductase, partial [Candidatus Omnitrophica bacterium]|nr:Gfo/Idh/MocA family oxidoreductase [Candidatus Omnitrophota bacterium]